MVKFININLPQPITSGSFGIRPALLVLFARPETIGIAAHLGGDDDQFIVRILFSLKAIERLQGAIDRMAIRSGGMGGTRTGALGDDDLVGEWVDSAQVVAQKRLAIEHDHAKGDARYAAHDRPPAGAAHKRTRGGVGKGWRVVATITPLLSAHTAHNGQWR